MPECTYFIIIVHIFLSRIHEFQYSETEEIILTFFKTLSAFFIIMRLIEHDLLAFDSSERALHFDGTLCALGDVNVKKMDSGVVFPGWRSTTKKRYERVFRRD